MGRDRWFNLLPNLEGRTMFDPTLVVVVAAVAAGINPAFRAAALQAAVGGGARPSPAPR